MDQKNKEYLTLKDFIYGLNRIIKGSKEDKIKFAFLVFDDNGNGILNKEELIKVLRNEFTHAEAVRKADEFCMRMSIKVIN